MEPGACAGRGDRGSNAAHDGSTPDRASLSCADIAELAIDLKAVWTASQTDARLRKRIVRTLIHEVVADIDDDASEIVLLVNRGWWHS